MRFLVRDPYLLNKVWTIEATSTFTIGELIRCFLIKRNGASILPSACQLSFHVGQLELLNYSLDTKLVDLGLSEDRPIETSWGASSLVPCPMDCPKCHLLTSSSDAPDTPPQWHELLDPPSQSPESLPESPPPTTAPGDTVSASPRKVNAESSVGSTSHQVFQSLNSLVQSVDHATDLMPRLERLVCMYQDGYLNENEFAQAKTILFHQFN
eukprot:Gregarina_sp_Pseudo_9__4443@NODE_45_length_5109_cov_42_945957_g42_i0_p3_GENE_NODE_45_length_5109_cov_42_945957_g42_i0NODE_45_length_5109_cov_42_945957_g42_i0_p3_ORF_typecomplete_len211_score1_88SRA1/PF07304_11/0_16_NODE_45_length_5109_cov_42_945957_g42_i014652097